MAVRQEWPKPWEPEEEIYPRSLRDKPKAESPRVDVWHLVRFGAAILYLSIFVVSLIVAFRGHNDALFFIPGAMLVAPVYLLFAGALVWGIWDWTKSKK